VKIEQAIQILEETRGMMLPNSETYEALTIAIQSLKEEK